MKDRGRHVDSLSIVAILCGCALVAGCAAPRALVALQQERVRLGMSAAETVREAGPPELRIARESVETYFYENGDRAVSISMLDGKVVGYDDRAAWPASAARAAGDADKPVGLGAVRVGMTEAEVVAALGPPDGFTAEAGLESLHWVTDDEADSVVEIQGGVVVGFVDYQINEYAQNVPRHDRDESTTSGALRVGMSKEAVQAKLGKPDSVSARDGVVTHRYDSNAIFGHDLVYAVAYKGDRVVGLSQHDVSLAEDEQEAIAERDAKATAQPSRSRLVSVLFAFLLNEGVQQALAQRKAARPAKSGAPARTPSAGGAPRVDTCSCDAIACGQIIEVQSCKARCVGARARCSCTGQCGADGNVLRTHSCGCI